MCFYFIQSKQHISFFVIAKSAVAQNIPKKQKIVNQISALSLSLSLSLFCVVLPFSFDIKIFPYKLDFFVCFSQLFKLRYLRGLHLSCLLRATIEDCGILPERYNRTGKSIYIQKIYFTITSLFT